jgi:hypothetical protein
MSEAGSRQKDAETKNALTSGRLFFLDLSAGRILSANPEGSDLKTVINEGRKLPDGLVLDVAAVHIYWTNMGDPKRNDGSIMRSDLNGKNMITIVPPGGTFTPKQLQLEKRSGKLHWSDREGMRVMRANLDGSELETLVDTSLGDSRPGPDQRKWRVGMAMDTDGGKFYDVTVVKDATADYAEEFMHAALVTNLPNYASAIVSTDEVINSISSLKSFEINAQ